MSFEEIWISYLVGASLWVAPKMLTTDPEGLPDALVREGVTVLHAVPTLLAFVPGLPRAALGHAGPAAVQYLWPHRDHGIGQPGRIAARPTGDHRHAAAQLRHAHPRRRRRGVGARAGG
ncbi:hypothetical protein G6F65_021472 [Rhizopus arrhizus]|nr:hypothetical protein G6F65_021472 [Rhizopus arrhizus]